MDVNKQKMEANLEEMKTTASVYRKTIEAIWQKLKACLVATHTCLEKTDTTTKAGQE
jgi:hypothetical protein